MKLIVVDDERDIQLLFEQIFRKEIKSGKVQIYYSLDGKSALEFLDSLENHSGYLILSDINMPEMTGIELLKEIKNRYPSLRVIMITAYGDEYNYNLAKKFGAEAYFTKPLEFELLKNKLSNLDTF